MLCNSVARSCIYGAPESCDRTTALIGLEQRDFKAVLQLLLQLLLSLIPHC